MSASSSKQPLAATDGVLDDPSPTKSRSFKNLVRRLIPATPSYSSTAPCGSSKPKLADSLTRWLVARKHCPAQRGGTCPLIDCLASRGLLTMAALVAAPEVVIGAAAKEARLKMGALISLLGDLESISAVTLPAMLRSKVVELNPRELAPLSSVVVDTESSDARPVWATWRLPDQHGKEMQLTAACRAAGPDSTKPSEESQAEQWACATRLEPRRWHLHVSGSPIRVVAVPSFAMFENESQVFLCEGKGEGLETLSRESWTAAVARERAKGLPFRLQLMLQAGRCSLAVPPTASTTGVASIQGLQFGVRGVVEFLPKDLRCRLQIGSISKSAVICKGSTLDSLLDNMAKGARALASAVGMDWEPVSVLSNGSISPAIGPSRTSSDDEDAIEDLETPPVVEIDPLAEPPIGSRPSPISRASATWDEEMSQFGSEAASSVAQRDRRPSLGRLGLTWDIGSRSEVVEVVRMYRSSFKFDLRLFDVVLLQMQAATYSVLHVRSCADSWRHSAFTIAVTLIARASKSESVARVTQLSKVRAEPPLVGVRKAKGASSLKTFSRDLQTLRMDRSGALACLSYLWDQAENDAGQGGQGQVRVQIRGLDELELTLLCLLPSIADLPISSRTASQSQGSSMMMYPNSSELADAEVRIAERAEVAAKASVTATVGTAAVFCHVLFFFLIRHYTYLESCSLREFDLKAAAAAAAFRAARLTLGVSSLDLCRDATDSSLDAIRLMSRDGKPRKKDGVRGHFEKAKTAGNDWPHFIASSTFEDFAPVAAAPKDGVPKGDGKGKKGKKGKVTDRSFCAAAVPACKAAGASSQDASAMVEQTSISADKESPPVSAAASSIIPGALTAEGPLPASSQMQTSAHPPAATQWSSGRNVMSVTAEEMTAMSAALRQRMLNPEQTEVERLLSERLAVHPSLRTDYEPCRPSSARGSFRLSIFSLELDWSDHPDQPGGSCDRDGAALMSPDAPRCALYFSRLVNPFLKRTVLIVEKAARRLLPMTPVGMVQSARPVPVDSAVMEFIGSPRQAPEPTSSPKPKSAGPSEPSTTSGKSVPAGKSEPSPIHAALDTPVWVRFPAFNSLSSVAPQTCVGSDLQHLPPAMSNSQVVRAGYAMLSYLLDVRSAGYLQAAEIFWGFSGPTLKLESRVGLPVQWEDFWTQWRGEISG
ncbi:unnamed protein product [Polarella glacialis]|uniref:Uncharacterized protein n=1 Tax=Polarella glacialis TaxID=89957 RepID=A0A813FGQ4_POLGL|nr:unnamed protein product [Polarella glacialis]